MLLTRRYRFCASHRLHTPALSEDQNRDVYGKCNNPFGHGHNYVLEVTVAGPVDTETGRLIDIRALDRLIEEKVIKAFDDRNLNREVSAFAESVPTTEYVVLEIRKRLKDAWTNAFPSGAVALAGLRVHETKRNIFEVTEET